MPRRSSRGRSAGRPAPHPATACSSAPQPVHHAPPPPPVQSSSGGSLLGGIGSTITQGMAFGTGSAVTHRAIDAVLGPRTIQHEAVVSEAAAAPAAPSNSPGGTNACGVQSRAFQDCLTNYGSNISKCCLSAGGAQSRAPKCCLLVMPCHGISDLDSVLILAHRYNDDDEAVLKGGYCRLLVF